MPLTLAVELIEPGVRLITLQRPQALNALTTQWEMSGKQSEMRNQLLAEQRRKAQAEQMRTAPIADLN